MGFGHALRSFFLPTHRTNDLRVGPVGFLSSKERAVICQHPQIRLLEAAVPGGPVTIRTHSKYPQGAWLDLEARVEDGLLHLVEPETNQAAVNRRNINGLTWAFPSGTMVVLREFGVEIDPLGLLHLGPMPFTPETLLEGVRKLTTACLRVASLPLG
jgi:hypothetical protein